MILKLDTTPYIASDGAIASLIGIAERSKIKQSDNAPKKISSNSTPQVSTSTMTIDAVASMGFGNMLDVNVKTASTYYLMELFVREEPVPGRPGGIIRQEHYGVSVRICVKAWSVDGSAATTLSMVAAKAQAGAASVAYQVDVIGIQTADILSLPGLISSSIGPFNVTKLQTAGAVFSELAAFVSSKPELCRPELLGVTLELNDVTMPYALTPSATYALGRIAAGFSYPDAVAKIPAIPEWAPPIQKPFIADLYRAAVDSLVNPPNQTQRGLADTVLKIGERK